MAIPKQSPLVVLVLSLTNTKIDGMVLQERLRKAGYRSSQPSFSLLMSRLKREKLVEVQRSVERYTTKNRIQVVVKNSYKSTAKGKKSLQEVLAFYENLKENLGKE